MEDYKRATACSVGNWLLGPIHADQFTSNCFFGTNSCLIDYYWTNSPRIGLILTNPRRTGFLQTHPRQMGFLTNGKVIFMVAYNSQNRA